MFFNNSSDDDPYGDIKRREEYERQQQINLSRGLGNFLYRYFLYASIWLFSGALCSQILHTIFGMHFVLTTIIGMISGFVLFKVPYVKIHPVKSLLTIGFVTVLLNISIS